MQISIELERLLHAAFSKSELDYLRNEERFMQLINKQQISMEEFERVAHVGNELLLERQNVIRKRL